MSLMHAILEGDRDACIEQLDEAPDISDEVKAAVADMLMAYPAAAPHIQRIQMRAKNPALPIQTAQAADGSTHAVGNFENVRIEHVGVFHVTLHGDPDNFNSTEIRIEIDFKKAVPTETIVE